MTKALFLDRDGIINVERDYIHKADDFTFVDGIFDLCRAAREHGYAIVVLTNQSGIGRGLYTEADYETLTSWMIGIFASKGIAIGKVYHCPFHPEATIERYRCESFDRKPNPGMLLRARDELGLDLTRSVLIGDRLTDIEAGRRAGVPSLWLLTHDTATASADHGHDDVRLASTLDDIRQRLFPHA